MQLKIENNAMLNLTMSLYFTQFTHRPAKAEFVRMSALMDAIIVPFAAVGKTILQYIK